MANRRRTAALLCAWLLALASPALADGPSFNGSCAQIAWPANTEADLAGYRLYDRVSLTSTKILIKTYGPQVTSATCSSLAMNAGQHYLSLSAFDLSGNESQTNAETPFVIVLDSQVNNLTLTAITSTSVTLQWTEVDAGNGAPASYAVRFATPLISWASATDVSSGTCTVPLAGVTIGATISCTVTGLSTTTAYQFQLVPFYGTLNVNAVFAPLSNIVSGTTGGAPPPSTRTTTIVDDFNRANGSLISPWLAGYSGQQIPEINSNAVRRSASGGAQSIAIYNATMPADQWAQVTISTIQGAGTVSAFVKLRHSDPATMSGIECRANRNNAGGIRSEIAKRTSGANTTLVSENSTTWANGDILDCEVQGETIKLSRISGGSTTELLSVSDPTYTAGKAGFAISAATQADGILDNFTGGGFAAAAVASPCGCDDH